MRRLHKKPTVTASPDIKVHEPRLSRWTVFLCKLLGRGYLFFFLGIARAVLHNEKNLIDFFQRALSGKSRCIVAFRHPNAGEPQLIGWFTLFKLRHIAASKGVRFPRNSHVLFVYSYEVVRYGGWVAKFILPNLKAMPIHNAKMDSQGMANIYQAIIEGHYPLALAPEGRVSYTGGAVPRLEPGAIRIGFHAANRLADKGSDCPLEILPMAFHYHFGAWGKLTLE